VLGHCRLADVQPVRGADERPFGSDGRERS